MDVDYNAVDTSGGDPIAELRRRILAGLPIVPMSGGTGAQPAPQPPGVPPGSMMNPTTPAVSFTSGGNVQPNPAPSPTAQPGTPAVSLTGKTAQQGRSAYDGVVATEPSDRGWLQHARFNEQAEKEKAEEEGRSVRPVEKASGTPAVSLTSSASSTDEAAQGDTPEFADIAANAARMFAAARSRAGQNAAQPRSAEDEYRDALRQEPTRDQFPAEKMPVWKKTLGALASVAAGAGGGTSAGETARRFFGSPERNAEQKFEQAHQTWEGNLGNLFKAAALHHQGMEDKNLQSEIDARSDKGTDHAKLADSYADAVSKAVKEGRDPLQDSDVKRYGDAIQNLQRETNGRSTPNETPFSVWRTQHPNDDVKEYFKLQPEARNETRPPKDQPRLTPGQKSTLARRYKDALGGIEQEFQERQSGSYVDKRSGELLPPMTADELTRRKQEAEDAYKDELEAGGEKVTRYNYGAGRSSGNETQNARGANSPTEHQVGDEVTYKGQRYRIAGIKNGKAQLSPLGSN